MGFCRVFATLILTDLNLDTNLSYLRSTENCSQISLQIYENKRKVLARSRTPSYVYFLFLCRSEFRRIITKFWLNRNFMSRTAKLNSKSYRSSGSFYRLDWLLRPEMDQNKLVSRNWWQEYVGFHRTNASVSALNGPRNISISTDSHKVLWD